jgi:hypothetical protein
MDFVGSFTQCQACLQRTGDYSCPYLDNKPAEGWQQLYNELITDGVGQGIRWATDIFWLGDSAQVDPNLCNTTKSPLMGGSLEQRERLLATALNSMTLPGEMVVSLSEKLDITRSVIFNQRNSPTAEKIAPVSFPDMGSPAYKIGIFEGDEGLFRPWQVQISNRWQGWDGEVKVQVLAGTQSADTAAGVIFVWRSDGSDDWQAFPAPVGLGGLRILSAAGDELVLQAESGSPVVFNWKTGAYLTDSDRH